MAKTSKVEKNDRVGKLIALHRARRQELVAIIKSPDSSMADKQDAYRALAKLPRNSSPVRYRNRCGVTGRPRGFLRKFRLSRITFRELALEGKLPGVTKSSW